MEAMPHSEYLIRLAEARRIEDASNVGGLARKLAGIYVQLEIEYKENHEC
jgi:hypothetical protein